MGLIDCPKCGYINSDTYDKCFKCGCSLKAQAERQSNQNPTVQLNKVGEKLQSVGNSMQNTGKKASRGCCGTIIGTFALLFIIGSCSALSSKSSNTSKSETADSSSVAVATQVSGKEEPQDTEELDAETSISSNPQETKSSSSIEEKPKERHFSNEEKITAFLIALDFSLTQNMGEGNYKIERSNESGSEMITISVWKEGLAMGSYYAKEGMYSAQTSWETMKESVSALAKGLYSKLEEQEIENAHLLLNVLNDANHDNILLAYIDGILTYDATR